MTFDISICLPMVYTVVKDVQDMTKLNSHCAETVCHNTVL